MDKLILCTNCNFEIPTCYLQPLEHGHTSKFCMHCGYSSLSLMVSGSEYYDQAIETMPQLYIDLIKTDSEGAIWFPTTVNKPEYGIVFVNGTNVEDAQWAGMKATLVKPEEREKFKKPGTTNEYYTNKIDNTTLKMFGKSGFLDSCEYIGIIAPPAE